MKVRRSSYNLSRKGTNVTPPACLLMRCLLDGEAYVLIVAAPLLRDRVQQKRSAAESILPGDARSLA